MEITTAAIQLALKKIAHLTCGTAPNAVSVVALGTPTTLLFAVCVPNQYRPHVYSYLAECLALPALTAHEPLVISPEQAHAVISIAATP
jgi:hypothetical protein